MYAATIVSLNNKMTGRWKIMFPFSDTFHTFSHLSLLTKQKQSNLYMYLSLQMLDWSATIIIISSIIIIKNIALQSFRAKPRSDLSLF
jgi:hypothetical protein